MTTAARYRLVSSLGKGGMGEVWLADDTQLGRKVAIKFLTEAENDATARERLHREARSAAALDHPYICKIYEIAEVDGRTGIVMEHVAGETLQAALARGSVSPQRALEIAGEIAEALEEAHTLQLVHRDLKPANVMVTAQGHVKVMDFGLAKVAGAPVAPSSEGETLAPITESGVRVGTPGYMAPEQLLGAQADTRSDIFAFGVVLYEMLAGMHPFLRTSQSGTMAAILRDPPAPIAHYQASLPESTTTTLDRLLTKNPAQRHQTFGDVRADLKRLLGEVSGVTPMAAVATPAPVATAETPAGGTRTRYVGRETERAEIRRLLDQTVEGQGATVLIGGEPGVGKTRITEELLREARERGCLALVGHCYETEGQPPFIPFVEMLERTLKIVDRAGFRAALGDAAPEVAKIAPELRRAFPDIPAPIELPPEQQRRFLFNAYQAFTERAVQVMPNVLVLEDLHWADEPTVRLMEHLAQNLTSLPLLVVGTYRDVELDVSRPFAKVLESLVRERLATRISLRRLPEADIRTLLEALGGPDPPTALARVVYHETEGNPFFVEEVFQHLREEGRLFDDEGRWRADLDTADLQVPEGVRLVIGRRLERVSDDTRTALTVAAIIGRNFDLPVLETAAAIDPDALLDALEEAERAQLITSAASGQEIRYTFSHELIRQTLHTNLSLPRRQRLHLRVAEAIEATYGGATERHAGELAHHFYQAGSAVDPDKTLRYLTLAGTQAIAASAFEEAVGHITTALSFDRLEARARADLLSRRGGALRSLAQADDAVADLTEALEAFETLGDPAGMSRALWDLGSVLLWQNRGADVLALAKRTEAAVPDTETPERARVLATLAGAHGWLGDYPTFVVRATEAHALAERLDDQRLLGQVLATQNMLWPFFKIRQLIDTGRVCAEVCRGVGDVWQHAETLSFLAPGLVCSGAPEEGCRVADEAEEAGIRIGHDGAVANARVARTYATAMLSADLDDVERLALSTADALERAGPWSFVTPTLLSTVQFWKGAWDEADRLCDEALALDPAELASELPRGHRFLLRAARGDRTWLDEYRERHAALFVDGRTLFQGDALFVGLAVEALAEIGEREEAHRLYPPLCDILQDGAVALMMWGLVEIRAGIAATAGEQWDAAEQHFETGLRQAHDIPSIIDQPTARRWYAWMLLDRDAPGDREKARTLLEEAIEMYGTIGMPKHVEMAEKNLKTT